MSDSQSILVSRAFWNSTLKVFVDEEVPPNIVGDVVTRAVEVTVTVYIFRDRPILHFVTFRV